LLALAVIAGVCLLILWNLERTDRYKRPVTWPFFALIPIAFVLVLVSLYRAF
jgi:hypothetical protein